MKCNINMVRCKVRFDADRRYAEAARLCEKNIRWSDVTIGGLETKYDYIQTTNYKLHIDNVGNSDLRHRYTHTVMICMHTTHALLCYNFINFITIICPLPELATETKVRELLCEKVDVSYS